ncbi:TetR/AcrR family transcriptional regulator [Treponema sp.]|uniref:TetR/AcrR family transcriptional regulator n=1 Tax=Treponema sp. TaxID=166 RepID=UPI00298DEA4F|nr:TetR/AcrR family transcriptional regulator [Treponema sp.]MCQ2241821.1 TetR/AcrR family transcriptional regulator [Treponema sp.]
MGDISEATKSKILQSAKKEFLEKGFMSASLRTIASNAGLTTGAMYRHFRDKDALFCALVDGAIDTTLSAVRLGGVEHHRNVENPAGMVHSEEEKVHTFEFLKYMLDNRDAFVLLFTKAAGSSHENFLEEISDLYTENVLGTIKWMKKKYGIKKPIDDMAIHVLANATVNAFIEVILHNMGRKEAETFLSNIMEIFHFGFLHLLGLSSGE